MEDRKKSRIIKLLYRRKENGQATIFMAFALLIVASFLAFVINIGLFVKAKINLQNAVDAGAWSGAAVQARQLSQIGYLNWELRNTFKEWMFKYYVIGQLGLLDEDNLTNVSDLSNGPVMNFRMQSMYTSKSTPANASASVNYNPFEFDPYNVPSVCIHFSGNYNICRIFALPGVPKFGSTGLVGIDGQTQNFANVISKDKSEDCAKRTDLNFMVAMIWAFGIYNGSSTSLPAVPNIAADRMGAWPQSFELGARIRNWEWIMNQPPEQNLCYSGDTTFGGCTPITDFDARETSDGTPFHERTIKGFYSVGRNLDAEMRRNLVVSELTPIPFQAQTATLSSFLIPETPAGNRARTKYYLNLKATPVNYTTFFTNFVPYSGKYFAPNSNREITMDARCAGSKMAIPVPSYILGFTKGQEVITYYALKAQTRYVGLFYPFLSQSEGALIKAYAAAKPFGGRIGPKLFREEQRTVAARVGITRTSYFASAFDVSRDLFDPSQSTSSGGGNWTPVRTPASDFAPGRPVPTTPAFWAQDQNDVLGGVDPRGNQSKFVLPNMFYEGKNETISGTAFSILRPANNETDAMSDADIDPVGLYSVDQYTSFVSHAAKFIQGNVLEGNGIRQAIESVRSPTDWEARNFLIPTNHDVQTDQGVEHAPVAPKNNINSYQLYAPLMGQGLVYEKAEDLQVAAQAYIETASNAIDAFLDSFEAVANSMRAQSSAREQDCLNDSNADASACRGQYTAAANQLHDGPPQPSCDSMAGKFAYFLTGNPGFRSPTNGDCGIKPLSIMMREYYDAIASNSANNQVTQYCEGANPSLFYCQSFMFSTNPNSPDNPGLLTQAVSNEDLMTGFLPGERRGASQDGQKNNKYNLRRNYYSTKLIPMSSLVPGAPSPIADPLSAYKDRFDLGASYEVPTNFINKIPLQELSEFADTPGELKF